MKPFVEDIVGDPTERKVTQMPLTQLARRPGCVEVDSVGPVGRRSRPV